MHLSHHHIQQRVYTDSPGDFGTPQTPKPPSEVESRTNRELSEGKGMGGQIMNTRISVTDFVRVTKKKLALCAAFPLMAVLILLFGFVWDEVLGLGGAQ